MAKYRKPVDVLLTLGDARNSLRKWPDYSAYEIGAEHIPDLNPTGDRFRIALGRFGESGSLGADSCMAGIGTVAGRRGD